MTKLVIADLKKQVNKLILVQCLLIIVVAVVFLGISGGKAALATAVGGLVHIVPCYFYASRLFSDVSARAVGKIITTFYVGEILKLAASVGLFIGLYVLYHLPLMPYLVGYIVATLSFCVAPMIMMSKK
jgi:ATP synthase protein I